ncbi:MAG: DUF4129 domain-containing protein [Candidatus Limnocylindria bacterium]
MRSSWPVRVLLPAAQSLAEGSWLAVLYAALQATAREVPHLGPLELGALVMAGTAWGRRRRGTSPRSEALGLLLLTLLSGLFGWMLSPDVRIALGDGNVVQALSLHVPGWLAALAFWRGDAHRFREYDVVAEHRLARWAVPGLAIPWLVGYAFADGHVQDAFAAAALIGTLFFIGSAFTALGLRRLEALRLSIGRDWSGDRSWLFMILGMALVVTVGSVPIAALLGIPAGSLLGAFVGPLQTIILLVVLLTAPIFLAAALLAGWLGSLLPRGAGFPDLSFHIPRGEAGSDLLLTILSVIVASFFLFEFVALLVLLWMAYGGRRRADPSEFEERAIVPPLEDEDASLPVPPARPRRVPVSDDVTAAYLTALEALAADGRWARRPHESPAAHVARIRAGGFASGAFGRLAAAYQLIRYGGRSLPDRERSRTLSRLDRLRAVLTRS